ncbi:PAS domain S-box protein, partial [Bacteroides thetaiotaomicron]
MQESERIFIAENATLLRGSERELNRQLFTILNSIYDGLYITDGQANTILINRAYEEVSGLRREDVLGKSMQEIVATGMIDRSGSLGVLKTRKPVTLEQTFRTGKQALITSTPHFDSSGEITMIITVVRDMTEIYGLQRKYQESEERRRSEMEFLQRNQRFVSRMVAADPRTLEVLARAQKVAALDTTILLLGETGVGKEQFARYIYENSARARQSFIGINCGAIPASLIESELFGYEKGAFTGASKEGKMGVFESADKGTVFLDEVGDLPLEMQVHLLRVLQEMQVRRVGGVRSISVDVRIIAACNADLPRYVEEGKFRTDLFYRLNTFPIHIPPLRERREDIPPLCRSLLDELSRKLKRRLELTPEALDRLLAHNWPGNVRELRNVLEFCAYLTPSGLITELSLPENLRTAPAAQPLTLAQRPR